ncbi:MAG: NTP transferase domain-containing protein [Nitriliruptorales bacterium]|nr:NTP transferase domain-containing protein [Nitriliruptorales bacterium]
MGSDKAVLVLDGQRLVDRAVQTLRECCDQVLVASGDGRRLTSLDVEQVADAEPGAGPLGGILAGLERAAHPRVAVVAVDMPEADPGVLRLLAHAWTGEAVVLPHADGRLQPLHAVWSRACASDLRDLLARGERSVTTVARQLGARVVEPGEWAPVAASPRFARNLNVPGDLGPTPT